MDKEGKQDWKYDWNERIGNFWRKGREQERRLRKQKENRICVEEDGIDK